MCFSGMTLALFLYMGHIPRIFARNLLYSQKTRFRVPKGGKGEKKKMWNVKLLSFLACICILQKQIAVCSFWKKKNSPFQYMIICQSATDFHVKLDWQSLSFFSEMGYG